LKAIRSNPQNSPLLESIRFEYLSGRVASEFYELISESIEMLTPAVWMSLRRVITDRKGTPSQVDRGSVEFVYREESPLAGVIHHLSSEGNVHERGIVNVTASSTHSSAYQPRNAADLSVNSEWLSHGEPDPWLCYDFKDRVLFPTHYSIQSADVTSGSPRSFPREWVLEGSNDGTTWVKLDHQPANRTLVGKSVIATFAVATPAKYRMVRIRQIGRNYGSEVYFGFRALEFFGALSLPGN
jgi:hypothetical protein